MKIFAKENKIENLIKVNKIYIFKFSIFYLGCIFEIYFEMLPLEFNLC